MLERLEETLHAWRDTLSRKPVVGPVVRALVKGQDEHVKDMAASTAYFTFFSLFPLFLGIVAVGSRFADPVEIQTRLDRLLTETLPGSEEFVRNNVEALVELRGAAGVVSAVGLLWSARKMFGAISRGINGALDARRNHPAILKPLRNLGLTIAVSLLVFLLLTVSTAFELSGIAGGSLISALFSFCVFCSFYRLVPYERLSWAEMWPGALTATLMFQIGKWAFVLYIENVAHLRAVYGSLSSIIVLLLWLYFSARVLLFGANLIAVRREPLEAP